ncbi:TonB-dependent receptor [Maricurvus nonylphenolicus]|uniref:TonB-dependent receptor n=1 Tax=Maricurvus nonylphenolicus TaxID=1008307 RepID=UPI0036F223BB
MKKINKNILSVSIASAMAVASAPQVLAEDLLLEEIVVTAQKRAQSLQDVPISISAMDGEKMSEVGISNLEDMSAYVPNFQQANSPLGQIISIRGISSGINQGFEQSVVQYFDDIAMGRGPMARTPLFDLERVEILRGPQNVLFGKNSIGGAISVTTAKPTDEFEGSVQVDYEPTFGRNEVQAVVSGGLTDDLYARLAVRSASDDGYYENTTTGDDEQQKEELTARLTLAWEPADDLSATLKLEHSSFDFEGMGSELIGGYDSAAGASYTEALDALAASTGLDIGEGEGTSNLERQTSFGEHSDNESNQIVLTVNKDYDNFTLTSVTGYIGYEYEELTDGDMTGYDMLEIHSNEEFDQFSQEIRFTSPGGETVDWIAGAYFQTWDLDYGQEVPSGEDNVFSAISAQAALGIPAATGFDPSNPANVYPYYGVNPLLVAANPAIASGLFAYSLVEGENTSSLRNYKGTSDTYSVFGQATWNYSEELRFTFGARYTLEEKDAERDLAIYDISGGGYAPASAGALAMQSTVFGTQPHAVEGDRREESVTGSAIVEWDATAEMMVYASVSNGFKAGGFDARASSPDNFEYEDESVITYEIGTKTELMGGRGELNAALFYSDYSDLQVSQFDGSVSFAVGNAAAAVSQGIELDGRFMITPELMLIGSMAYLDFSFEEYEDGACPSKVTLDTSAISCDYSGKPATFAPEWTASITLDYQRPLSDLINLRMTMDTSYRSEQYIEATLDPYLLQDSETNFNARIALESEQWMVALVGKNLTDNDSYSYGYSAPLSGSSFIGAPSFIGHQVRPRSYTIQVKYNF